MIIFIIFVLTIIYTFSKYMETDRIIYFILFLATMGYMFYFYGIIISEIIEQNKYLYSNNINF